MSAYQTSKKVRYTTSIIYIIFMTFIVGGTYLFQQEPTAQESTSFGNENN